MIQDGPQNTGADKPLRISGEPFKVQVGSILFHVHFSIKIIQFLIRLACGVQQFFIFGLFLTASQRNGDGTHSGSGLPGAERRVWLPYWRRQFRCKLDGYPLHGIVLNMLLDLKCGLFFQVPVPRFAVGIVIGRNGEMIKKIQNDTGVRIQFKPGEWYR